MSRVRMSGEQRREQLIEISAKLFSEHGFDQTTTKMIAKAAGVNEAVIYKHFDTKEGLYDAAIQRFINEIIEKVHIEALSNDENIEEMLTAIAGRVTTFYKENIHIIRMLLYSGLQEHRFTEQFFDAIISKLIALSSATIRKGQSSGRFRTDIDPLSSAMNFIGPLVIFNLARNIFNFPRIRELNPDTFIENLVKIFTQGIQNLEAGEKI